MTVPDAEPRGVGPRSAAVTFVPTEQYTLQGTQAATMARAAYPADPLSCPIEDLRGLLPVFIVIGSRPRHDPHWLATPATRHAGPKPCLDSARMRPANPRPKAGRRVTRERTRDTLCIASMRDDSGIPWPMVAGGRALTMKARPIKGVATWAGMTTPGM
jgi:hypothetical protein